MRFGNVAGRPSVLVDDLAYPVGEYDPTGGSFIETIRNWPDIEARALDGEPMTYALDELGPPVPRPGQVLGTPVNYVDHQAEMKAEHTVAGLGFFLKSPSSVVGPDGCISLPFPGRRTDQEAELGVVIGATTTNVGVHEALDSVFGYTCLVDVTVRGREERSTRKSFAGFTPIGPWIVTADEIPDPTDLRLRGWVNDELRQDTSTSEMVYGVAQLIELMSSVVTLEPGDLIATGTPAGVGPIVAGDVVTVEVEGVGRLCVPVVMNERDPHPLWC